MMLSTNWEWSQFRKRTSIPMRSRGKNMEGVDDALKAYWDSLRVGPKAEIHACFALLKACNAWMKKKKDKAIAGKGKKHFKTRWDEVKALGNAAFVEAAKGMRVFKSDVGDSQLDFERKKLKSMSSMSRPTKSLSKGYDTERKLWLGSNKTQNPISGTTLNEMIETLTKEETISYNDKLARKYGGAPVLGKDFSNMSVKDWMEIDGIMQQIEAETGAMKRHVAFLKKSERLQYMAIVKGGRLVKDDGSNWDTGTWDLPFAMDEYGNLFIGEGSIVTTSSRLNHSSLLAGNAVLCAGTLQIQGGLLTKFNNNSGHYKPTGENVYQGLQALQDEGVDLSQTRVTVIISATHGFDNLTAAQVIGAQGKFSLPKDQAHYY